MSLLFIPQHERSVISKGVVIKEQTTSDVERYEHIYRIMFVGSKDKEYTKEIEDPGCGVDIVHPLWSIWKQKSEYEIG